MKEETLKKLGFCRAFEFEFGTDTYWEQVKIVEEADEYDEWQDEKTENEEKIEQYKEKFLNILRKE